MRLARSLVSAVVCGIGCSLGATALAMEPYYTPGGPAQYSPNPQLTHAPDSAPYGLPNVPDNGPWQTPQGLPPEGTSVRDPYIVRSFYRAEYLSLTIREPGAVLLGAPIADVDPFSSFPVVNEDGDDLGTARIPNLSGLNLKSIVGVRNTFGWEFLDGSMLEFNAFVTENGIKRIGQETLEPGQLFATSVLINGQVSDGITDGVETPNLFFYNQQYYARYSSRVWGAELNYFWDPSTALMFEFRPMVGLRYNNLYEKIEQRGRFQADASSDVINSSIDTGAYNNIIAPQIGLRVEAPTKYLTFGAESKFGWGPNFVKAEVTTTHLRDLADGTISTDDHSLRFSTVLDFAAYVRWHATDNLSLSLGYMMTYLGTVTRGSTATYYNDTGDLAQPPGVIAKADKTDIYWRGFNLGAELHW